MTTLDLDALERAARAATPGEWKAEKPRAMEITGRCYPIINKDRYPAAFVPAWDEPEKGEVDGSAEAAANAELVSLCNPATILSLISDYRALQERVEGAEKALRPFAEASRAFDEAALHFGAALPDDAHRPRTEFTHGQLRAARSYFAARTKAGEPHV